MKTFVKRAIVVVMATASLVTMPASAAPAIIASNGTNSTSSSGIWEQSITAGTTGNVYKDVTFTFNDRTGRDYAPGSLYLFSKAYGGTPNGLPSADATTGFMAKATSANNLYTFGSNLTLVGGQQYFAYSDTKLTQPGAGNGYPGGNAYLSQGPDQTYSSFTSLDMGFRANATPEPATWSLMIVGFGLAGTALRRQRRVERVPVTA